MMSSARKVVLTERREPPKLEEITAQFPKRAAMDRAKGWKGLINILSAEHKALERLLNTLEVEVERLEPKRVPDYHLLADILHYLTYYPDEFHHNRENIIFAKTLLNDGEPSPALKKLVKEHKDLAAMSRAILAKFDIIIQGEPAKRPELLKQIADYIRVYRLHMDFEQREVFPLATGTFSDTEWRQLEDSTRFVDDPLFGGDIHYRYKRLAEALRGEVDHFRNVPKDDKTNCITSVLSGINYLASMPFRLIDAALPFRRH